MGFSGRVKYGVNGDDAVHAVFAVLQLLNVLGFIFRGWIVSPGQSDLIAGDVQSYNFVPLANEVAIDWHPRATAQIENVRTSTDPAPEPRSRIAFAQVRSRSGKLLRSPARRGHPEMNRPEYQAVRAIVLRDSRVLLGKSTLRPVWSTFGGKSEAGETVEATLFREIEEELGITPASIQRLGDRTQSWDGGSALIAVFAVLDYEGIPANCAPHELESIEWFNAEQIKGLPMAELARTEVLSLLGREPSS